MATKVRKEPKPYGRAYLADVSVSLGMVTVVGDLVSTTATNADEDEKFKMICPTCGPDDPHGMGTRYHCDAGHGPFKQGDIPHRAKEIGGRLVPVSAEEVAAAKESSFEKNSVELHVHDAEEVDKNTIANGKPYVLWPNSFSMKAASIFLNSVDEAGHSNGKSLLGILNTGRGEKLVRLQRWNGMLVLQEMLRPEDVREFNVEMPAPDEKHLNLARTLIDSQVEDFESEVYKKSARDRLRLLVEAAEKGESAPLDAVAPKPIEQEQDIEALLMASLASAGKS